jgi:hypothetical protein
MDADAAERGGVRLGRSCQQVRQARQALAARIVLLLLLLLQRGVLWSLEQEASAALSEEQAEARVHRFEVSQVWVQVRLGRWGRLPPEAEAQGPRKLTQRELQRERCCRWAAEFQQQQEQQQQL